MEKRNVVCEEDIKTASATDAVDELIDNTAKALYKKAGKNGDTKHVLSDGSREQQ